MANASRNIREAFLSVATRQANASENLLFHIGHNLWLSHFVGSFHRYDTYADLASLRPLFQITDARNYLIVVIREIPHIISFPRIIGRNQLWLLSRSAAKLVHG